jgi:hypothetical protein
VPQAGLSVRSPTMTAPSPRNSFAESVYETGEEDFEDASDGEADKSDATAAGRDLYPAPVPQSPGTALAAFKDTIAAPTSDAAMSVSTAGPYSANGTQPARRKSVRINPDPPEMSATPASTPGMELEEEPQWVRGGETKQEGGGGGWATRIGRGWEDSSEESDEEYERVRKALVSSYKHLDAVNAGKAKEKDVKGKARR